MVQCVYTFSVALNPWRKFATWKFTLRLQVLRSPILSALLHGTPAAQLGQPNFAAWYNECNYGTFAEGVTYFGQGGHHAGHRPTFKFYWMFILHCAYNKDWSYQTSYFLSDKKFSDFCKWCLFDLDRNTQKHFPEHKTAKNVFMKNREGAPEAPLLGSRGLID